jgi:hypothetical protein
MLSNDLLLQLTADRKREREVSAEKERLAVLARGPQRRRTVQEAGGPGVGLLQLLAARRHATS